MQRKNGTRFRKYLTEPGINKCAAGDSNPKFGSTNVGKERVSTGRFFTVPTAVPISLKKR